MLAIWFQYYDVSFFLGFNINRKDIGPGPFGNWNPLDDEVNQYIYCHCLWKSEARVSFESGNGPTTRNLQFFPLFIEIERVVYTLQAKLNVRPMVKPYLSRAFDTNVIGKAKWDWIVYKILRYKVKTSIN